MPFETPWGASIWVRVLATNVIGSSEFSEAGNGAILLSVPGAPTDLNDLPETTTGFQIGLSWIAPVQEGGVDINDYRIFSDLGLGTSIYEIIDSNVLTEYYTMEALTPGVTYSIKVAARNIYGYGVQSEAISILAAQEPFQPIAPVSTLVDD